MIHPWLAAAAAALPLAVQAGPISRFDTIPTAYTGETRSHMEDIERCLIDLPNLGPAYVYKQGDRYTTMDIIWMRGRKSIGRVALVQFDGGTSILSWLPLKTIKHCLDAK